VTYGAASAPGPTALVRLRFLHQFHQYPSESRGVNERDGRTSGTRPRRLVHQRDARGTQSPQHGCDVRDPVADVVDALATSGQKAPHRRLRTERAEELDVGRSHREEDLLYSLVLDPFAMRRFQTEGVPVLLDGGLEVGHGDPDVIDVEQEVFHRYRLRLRRPAAGAGCSRLMRSFASGM
jgi:hypothetical protein